MAVGVEEAAELAADLLESGRAKATRFGAGKFSETFSVEADDEQYVLRIAPSDSVLQLFYEQRMMRQEPAIHQRLLTETQVPVPHIIAHDFSRTKIDRDYLIMPRLPGRPLSDARLMGRERDRAMREWGQYVAQIHSVTDGESRFGYLGEHNCMEPQRTWRDAFVLMYKKLLDDVVGCGVYTRDIAATAMAVLNTCGGAFDSCETSRLCHGDLWMTNLLVDDDGGVTGVIDFDRACWGDIEWDLAIAEYCGVTEKPFWEGYGRHVEQHEGDAAVRRFFYLLYEHQKYIVISMSIRRDDPKGARRYATESLGAMEKFARTGVPTF